MRLLVQCGGKSTALEVPDDVTASNAALLFEAQSDTAAHAQKWIHKGRVLSPQSTLAACGLKDGSKVLVLASGTVSKARRHAVLQHTGCS